MPKAEYNCFGSTWNENIYKYILKWKIPKVEAIL